jgi:hypothetical protein
MSTWSGAAFTSKQDVPDGRLRESAVKVFELLVYDFNEDFDDLPSTLTTVEEWLSKRPYPLSSQSTVGLRISDGTHELVTRALVGCRRPPRAAAPLHTGSPWVASRSCEPRRTTPEYTCCCQ